MKTEAGASWSELVEGRLTAGGNRRQSDPFWRELVGRL